MSGDVMQFPKTVEEFMEKYKIVDTEHVYTNGTELVPIFRMKQWFEHIGAEPNAEDIDNAPTIDAVQVVRCKDCKYYEGKNTYCANDRLATPDDYCSIGERREE